MGKKDLINAVIVSISTGVCVSKLRNVCTQYISESGLHIGIKKNGHTRLIQLIKQARTILDERAKSDKDNLVFPFKINWYRDKWYRLRSILKF